MTNRDRTLGLVIGGIVLVGTAIGGGTWLAFQYFGADKQIADLKNKVDESRAKVEKAKKEQARLENWRAISLPADPAEARALYRKQLLDLIDAHKYNNGLSLEDFPQLPPDTKSTINHPSKLPGKVPLYTGINATFKLRTKIANLVSFIKDFQAKTMMHRIKTMTIERPLSDKKGDFLQVSLTVEALIILDADLVKSDKPKKKEPLNPPQPDSINRTYSDITKRNVFVGYVPPEPIKDPVTPDPPKVKDPPKSGPPLHDVVNMMRFNRYIGYMMKEETLPSGRLEVRKEAWLWDALFDHKERLKDLGGFNKFPMLQTGNYDKLVHGVIQKKGIIDSDIVFRVELKSEDATSAHPEGLITDPKHPKYNAKDPKLLEWLRSVDPSDPSFNPKDAKLANWLDSKWWRYPIDENFYNLHDSDFKELLSLGKVKKTDERKLYVVNVPYWEKLTPGWTPPGPKEKGGGKGGGGAGAGGGGAGAGGGGGAGKAPKGKATYTMQDKSNFRDASSTRSGGPGQVVYADTKVVVIKLDGQPPKFSIKSSLAVERIYPKEKTIYKVHDNHLKELKENTSTKAMTSNAKVKDSAEEARTFVIRRQYWDELRYSTPPLITTDTFSKTTSSYAFKFFGDLVKGQVYETPEVAVLVLDEKYCYCPGTTDRNLDKNVSASKDMNVKKDWHLGYMVLQVDTVVQDALVNPLDISLNPALREFLKTEQKTPEDQLRQKQYIDLMTTLKLPVK